MTETEFKSRHPDLYLQCGKSSEDGMWWVDLRQLDGRFVEAFRGKLTLSEALEELEERLLRRTERRSYAKDKRKVNAIYVNGKWISREQFKRDFPANEDDVCK
jgi:hypothetical protein